MRLMCREQAKLFPQYFAVAVAAVVMQIGTLAFGVPGGIAKPQLITLGMYLLSSLVNAVVYPLLQVPDMLVDGLIALSTCRRHSPLITGKLAVHRANGNQPDV